MVCVRAFLCALSVWALPSEKRRLCGCFVCVCLAGRTAQRTHHLQHRTQATQESTKRSEDSSTCCPTRLWAGVPQQCAFACWFLVACVCSGVEGLRTVTEATSLLPLLLSCRVSKKLGTQTLQTALASHKGQGQRMNRVKTMTDDGRPCKTLPRCMIRNQVLHQPNSPQHHQSKHQRM